MLCLSRRLGERIIIDGVIVVEVLQRSRDGKIRLGITAPKEVQVDRAEVHQRRLAQASVKP